MCETQIIWVRSAVARVFGREIAPELTIEEYSSKPVISIYLLIPFC